MSILVHTVTIQIGNSDDKLPQKVWAHYVRECHELVRRHSHQLHFGGGSSPYAPWQNHCWVMNVQGTKKECKELLAEFVRDLEKLRKRYDQDSVAITVGNTEFI